MLQHFFSIPVFIDKVDLNKIWFENDNPDNYSESFVSDIKTNINSSKLSKESIMYLSGILDKNFKELGNYKDALIQGAWRNIYKKNDHQQVHIHPHCKWSFIIYETIKESKTIFLHPAWKLLEITFSTYERDRVLFQKIFPKFTAGDLVVFPSFLEHYVLSGAEGSTIAGNISARFIPENYNENMKYYVDDDC